jgi:MSHA pilin protein MshD
MLPPAPAAPVPPPTALKPPRRRQRPVRRAAGGFTLIELIVFIVVVSAALAGVLRIFTQATAASADPMQRRQALAIAESLLDEVMLMPFTFCDGDDANVETATSSAGCASAADALGAEAGEGRFAPPQFDHVNDYHGLAMTGIVDITNGAVAGLAGYSASIAVAPAALGTITAASGDALRITVTVTTPGGDTLTLDGYRSRHAPHASL